MVHFWTLLILGLLDDNLVLEGALSREIDFFLLYFAGPLFHYSPDSFVVHGGALGAEDAVIGVLRGQIWRNQINFDRFPDAFQSLLILLHLLCVRLICSDLRRQQDPGLDLRCHAGDHGRALSLQCFSFTLGT